MKRIRVGIDAVLALVLVLLCERADIFLIYGSCAVLHEIGHLAAARARDIEIKQIRIDISGARICTEQGAGSYTDEFILCMAGPLVNVIIVVVGALIIKLRGIEAEQLACAMERFMTDGEPNRMGIAAFFVTCAAVQGMVNLLPIRTLDGGRMLYCLTAKIFSQAAAERILGVTGALCAFAIWTVALFLMLKIGAGLGIYVFCACLFFSTVSDRSLVKN